MNLRMPDSIVQVSQGGTSPNGTSVPSSCINTTFKTLRQPQLRWPWRREEKAEEEVKEAPDHGQDQVEGEECIEVRADPDRETYLGLLY